MCHSVSELKTWSSIPWTHHTRPSTGRYTLCRTQDRAPGLLQSQNLNYLSTDGPSLSLSDPPSLSLSISFFHSEYSLNTFLLIINEYYFNELSDKFLNDPREIS